MKKSKPVKTWKSGAITLAAFENTYRLEHFISRTFQDRRGEWKFTRGLRIRDLDDAIKVLNQAKADAETEEAIDHDAVFATSNESQGDAHDNQ